MLRLCAHGPELKLNKHGKVVFHTPHTLPKTGRNWYDLVANSVIFVTNGRDFLARSHVVYIPPTLSRVAELADAVDSKSAGQKPV